MIVAAWVAAVASFVGAVLAFVGARAGARQQEGQSQREEWGRRFTAALGAVAGPDPRGRALGRVVLVDLARSQLATPEERELADHVLEEDATFSVTGPDLRRLPRGANVDDIVFVADDEPEDEERSDD